MIDIKELRRLAQAAVNVPDGVSLTWIKHLEVFQQEVGATLVLELLDRLEEAESDALEQARINGMGSEREASLMAKLEAAEKECDALRADLKAMKQQKPIAWRAVGGSIWGHKTSPDDVPLFEAAGAADQPDADGWIEWRGGECPVDTDAVVDVRLRVIETGPGHAGEFDWLWGVEPDPADIIAYRVR